MGGQDWVRWHEKYDEPGSQLQRRLAVVRRRIREALDAMPAGPVTVISMCAGQGRDLLGALADHPRRTDVRARLVELDPDNAGIAERTARSLGLPGVQVVTGDASLSTAYAGYVPADLVLVCGVFGALSEDDIRHTVRQLPRLCAPGATVVWTKHRGDKDVTPAIRDWFAGTGFTEIAFDTAENSLFGVGTHRLTGPALDFEPGIRLFEFGSAPDNSLTLSEGLSGQPAEVVDALARTVAEVMPLVASRIPAEPAARLGRLRTSDGPTPSSVVQALGMLGPVLPERLLGALELTVDGLTVDVPDGLREPAEPAPRMMAFIQAGGQSEAIAAASALDHVRPGTTALVHQLAAALAGHPAVRPLLAADGADEAEIAARHGAAYLALAVGTATAVLRARDLPVVGTAAAAVVGAALGTAALLLMDAPMPPAYREALLARRRAEYRPPVRSVGAVMARDHRFALVEGAFPESVEVTGNGLVGVVPGGAVIHTGTAAGEVRVRLDVLADPPDTVELRGWDEVVEVSWTAATGGASVLGQDSPGSRQLPGETPPWPGEYRLRVHASGRDDARSEVYRLVVWSAPAAPEIVHKRTDRLGQRLRGEPVGPAPAVPEAAYRWIRDTPLSEAATITVVTGCTPEEVLRAFGAEPSAPASLTALGQSFGIDPWVAVLAVGDGTVLAVEPNGWQGSQRPVLRALSQRGRAASMYWNVNALTRLSLAEAGEVRASFEPGLEPVPADPAVTAVLTGLDLDDYRDKVEKGLVAVERFTGQRVGQADIDRIQAAGVAYAILPLLPELYPEERLPDGSRRFAGHGPLGSDTDALAFLPDERLRDLAWWAAGEVVSHAGLADHPAVQATLAARALSPQAEILARTSQLGGRGEHHWLWKTLHRATNPDPLAAAIGALDAARYAVAGTGADLLDRARRQIQ